MQRALSFIVSLPVLVLGCGPNTSSSASPPGEVPMSGKESASEIALASASGSLADAEGVSTDLALNLHSVPRRAFEGALDVLFPTAFAAPTPCPVLSNATLAQCADGKLTLALDSCSYERLNKSFAKGVWMGSKLFDFGGTCPKRLADITELTRTVGDGTSRTGAEGGVLEIDTSTPSGYDSSISPQPSGGTSIQRMLAARTIDILGIHYIARKSAASAVKLWDHTISTADPLAVKLEANGKRTLSGTVIVQHNLLMYTAKAELSDIVFDFATCGCLPVSGSITTTLSGSRTGTETFDIMGCADADYTSEKHVKTHVTLSHCL